MSSRRIESFVVRLVVRDDGIEQPDDWNGRIQHITTGDECQFSQLQDLLSFMAAYLRDAGVAAQPQATALPTE